MKKDIIIAQLKKISGILVDMTVVNSNTFTFHFDGRNDNAANKIANFFRPTAKSITTEYHADIDYTVITLNA